jgi:hypothetical protein
VPKWTNTSRYHLGFWPDATNGDICPNPLTTRPVEKLTLPHYFTVPNTDRTQLGGVELQTASAVEREAEDANSKPSFVEWEARENTNRPTTDNRTTVIGVVTDKLLQKAKFVDRDYDLGYDETEGSICKFVTTYCNLQANIDICTSWWKEAFKWIPTYISCLLRNMTKARP